MPPTRNATDDPEPDPRRTVALGISRVTNSLVLLVGGVEVLRLDPQLSAGHQELLEDMLKGAGAAADALNDIREALRRLPGGEDDPGSPVSR